MKFIKTICLLIMIIAVHSKASSADGINDMLHLGQVPPTLCSFYMGFTMYGREWAFRPADNFAANYTVAQYTSDALPSGRSLGGTASQLLVSRNIWASSQSKVPSITTTVTFDLGWPNSSQGLVWFNGTDFEELYEHGEPGSGATDYDPNQYRKETVLIALNKAGGSWSTNLLSRVLGHELGHTFGLEHAFDWVFGGVDYYDGSEDCEESIMGSDQYIYNPTDLDGAAILALFNKREAYTWTWGCLMNEYGAFGSTAYLQTVTEERCREIILRGFATTASYPTAPETIQVVTPHGGYGLAAQYVVGSVPSRSLYDWVVVDSLGPSQYSQPFASTSQPTGWDSIYAVSTTDIDSIAEPESLEAASSEWTGGSLNVTDSTFCADIIVYSYADSMAVPIYNQVRYANPGSKVMKLIAYGSPADMSANECRRQLNAVWQFNSHWNDLWGSSTGRHFPVAPAPEVYIVGNQWSPSLAMGYYGVGMASLPDTANYCGHPECRSDLLIYDLDGDGLPEGPVSRVTGRTVDDVSRAANAAADFDSMRYVETAGHVLVFTEDRTHEFNSTVAQNIASAYAVAGFPVRPLLKASQYPTLADRPTAFKTQLELGTREVFGLDGETGMALLPGHFQHYSSALGSSARQRVIGWFPNCNIHAMWQNAPYWNAWHSVEQWMRNGPTHSVLAASVAHMDIGRGANHMLGAQYLASARLAVPLSDRNTSVARVLYNAVIDASATQPHLRDHMLCLSALGSFVRVNPAFASGGGGGGCPVAESMTEGGWIEENTVLARSEGGTFGIDGLRLAAPLALDGGKYRVRLRENEQERTTLDAVSLALVDRDPAVKSYRTESGYVLGSRRASGRMWRSSGQDLTALLSGQSLEGITLEPGDTIYVADSVGRAARGLTTSSTSPGVVATEDDSLFDMESMSKELPPDDLMRSGLHTEGTLDQRVLAGTGLLLQQEAGPGEWTTIRRLYPRAKFEEAVTPGLGPGTVRIIAIGRHRLRFVGRVIRQASTVAPTLQSPVSAQHTRLGNVRSAIGTQGGQVTYLEPGDTLNLEFTAPALPDGKVRDLFLVTRGVYTSLSSSGLNGTGGVAAVQFTFDLSPARPNPTTGRVTIGYSLARPTRAELRLYNVAGRLVRTVLEDQQEAGPHEVVWDGTDEHGARVPSGVYFYRLQAAGWSSERKLVVVQR